MAFDFSTLVADRTQQDVDYARKLAEKLVAGTATEEEKAEWNSFTLKGVYNHTDLNRVTAAMADLKLRLESYGYAVPGYQQIEVPHPVTGGGNKLPDGYIELTYIESTGTQYIDTGFKPNQDTRVVIDFELLQVTSTVTTIFGQRNNTAETDPLFYVFHVLNSGNTVRSDYFGAGVAATLNIVGQRVVVDKNRNVCTVGETVLTNTPATGQGVWNLYLFGLNDRGGKKFGATAKVYSCQIYDNGALIRDYVPCINPNGEVGLYDTVTKSFFGNSGTGAFISGARVGIVLPEEYTRVEYIESTGTQYINTGISVPHASCKIAVKFKTRNILDRPPVTGYAYTTWSWSVNMMFPYQNVFYANGGSTGIAFAADTLYNAEYTNSYVTVNGTTVQKSIANTVDGYNNTIFYGSTRYGAHLLYEYRLYNAGTLVRDMIPVIRKQDGEVGLYDLVNGVFYGNTGTGSFIAGSVVDIVLPSGYKRVEYLESTGTQECRIPPVNTTGDFELAFDVTPVQYATWSCLLTNIGKGGIWIGKVNTGTFSLRTYSGSNHVNATLPELNKRLSVGVKCVTGTSSFYLNGVSQGTASVAYTETASCALLSDGAGGGFIGRLYSCQIYESGVLVRNFVPCVNSSNEAGLYDMVNGVFYKNAGTGTFTTGNVIPSPPQPIIADPYTWYEFDWPTPEAMTLYLLNVAAIRTVLSVLQSTPSVPLDMEKLMVKEANDIEQIVLDVYRQVTIMPTTFIACGEALCGGDNL